MKVVTLKQGKVGELMAKVRQLYNDQLTAQPELSTTDMLMLEDAAHSGQEIRIHALGQTDDGRALHITVTLRNEGTLIRVISARDMHRKERVIYDQTS